MKGLGIGLACLAFVLLLGMMLFAGQSCSGSIGATSWSMSLPNLPPAPPSPTS